MKHDPSFAPQELRRSGLPLLLVVLVLLPNCATVHTMPAALKGRTATDVIAQLNRKHRDDIDGFVGDMRITYFGDQGRIKGKATFAIQRPASIRYEAMGPHGGAVQAFACNGTRVYFLDIAQSRFVEAAATAHNMDALIGFAQLNLAPSAWVELFLSGVTIPPNATMQWQPDTGQLKFESNTPAAPNTRLQIFVDPERLEVVRILTLKSGTVFSDLRVGGYDEHHIPESLDIEFTDTTTTVQSQVRLRLQNIDINPKLSADVFMLEAPAGVVVEAL